MPNSPELIRAAQSQLARIGCFSGKSDGVLSPTTKSGVGRYMSFKGSASSDAPITEDLVSELTKQTARVCPLECKAGEIAKGETCVAQEKSATPATASHEEKPAARKQPKREAEREQPRRSRPQPRAKQEAAARPSSGGGGGHTMIGVGF